MAPRTNSPASYGPIRSFLTTPSRSSGGFFSGPAPGDEESNFVTKGLNYPKSWQAEELGVENHNLNGDQKKQVASIVKGSVIAQTGFFKNLFTSAESRAEKIAQTTYNGLIKAGYDVQLAENISGVKAVPDEKGGYAFEKVTKNGQATGILQHELEKKNGVSRETLKERAIKDGRFMDAKQQERYLATLEQEFARIYDNPELRGRIKEAGNNEKAVEQIVLGKKPGKQGASEIAKEIANKIIEEEKNLGKGQYGYSFAAHRADIERAIEFKFEQQHEKNMAGAEQRAIIAATKTEKMQHLAYNEANHENKSPTTLRDTSRAPSAERQV